MSEFFADNLIWVALYPLWVCLLIGVARFFAVRFPNKLITLFTLMGSLIGLVFSVGAIPFAFANTSSVETVFTFININNMLLQLGVAVDRLGVICLALLYGVSFFVHLYSASYVAKEPKYYRFFAYLNLFNFAMAMLLLAPNLFQVYVGWELIGLISYLFIGFKYDCIFKSKSALKVFLINRVGDTAFFAGLVTLVYIMTSYAPTRFITLDFSDFNLISTLAFAYTNEFTFVLLCSLFLVAALVKSAQFPFQTWLLSAMSAATPVSALIHSSTLVIAGVFLLLRLLPLVSLAPIVMSAVAVIGIVSAIYCSLCAVAQTDVKSTLAYSTSAHLGLIFTAIGFGNLDLAVIYLIIHGVVKAALFLSYGVSNNEYEEHKEIILLPSFVVGSILLSGLLFVGLNLKELFWAEFQGNLLLALEYLLVVFLGAVYIFRLCALYFSNKERVVKPLEQVSIWSLLGLTVLSTFWIKGGTVGLPFYGALLGALVALVYNLKFQGMLPKKLALTVKNGFYIDNLFTRVVPSLYNLIANVASYFERIFTENQICFKFMRFWVRISVFLEKYVYDYPTKLLVFCVKFASREFEIVQTKNVLTYVAYGALIIGVVFTSLLLTFSIIINSKGGIG